MQELEAKTFASISIPDMMEAYRGAREFNDRLIIRIPWCLSVGSGGRCPEVVHFALPAIVPLIVLYPGKEVNRWF